MHIKEEVFAFRPKINKISEMLIRGGKGQNGGIEEPKKESLDKLKMQNEYEEMK
jgi:hypothetical protein